jgi:hypothetical protein
MPADMLAATARLTAKVGTAIHSAGRVIVVRRGGDMAARGDIPMRKFARIWFRNPFAIAKNPHQIGANAPKLWAGFKMKWPGKQARP